MIDYSVSMGCRLRQTAMSKQKSYKVQLQHFWSMLPFYIGRQQFVLMRQTMLLQETSLHPLIS